MSSNVSGAKSERDLRLRALTQLKGPAGSHDERLDAAAALGCSARAGVLAVDCRGGADPGYMNCRCIRWSWTSRTRAASFSCRC